ncbi:hypothetical protein J1N35_007998, partial [Gossypium stocksii]
GVAGYRLLHGGDLHNHSHDSNNQVSSNKKLFQCIWQSSMPPKIKIRSWRFTQNFIPTQHNLYIKHVFATMLCLRCSSAAETTIHVIRDCVLTKDVRRSLVITWPEQCNEMDFKN